MTESTPDAGTRATRHRRTRNRAAERLIGGTYLALGLGALIFGVVTWALGRLNPVNALVFAIATAATLPLGVLALRGDYVGTRGMDEGQREMNRAAQADAFYVAYFGLFVLFLGNVFVPNLLAQAQIEVGVLLWLVVMTWLIGYLWRRWRP